MVHLCTGVSANFEFATCLIYLLFAAGKFEQSFLVQLPPKMHAFGPKKLMLVLENYLPLSGRGVF